MVKHASDRLTKPDRDLNTAMREVWPQLPAPLRKTASNIATIRIGLIGYAILLPASIINKAAESTPIEFANYLLSFTPVAGIIGLIAIITIVYLRSTRTAPDFLTAYYEIMPGFAERIDAQYHTRGLGDLFAPWIRARRGIFAALLGRLANRFSIKP